MKKTIFILMICLLLAVGCAGKPAGTNADTAEELTCATMGDALAASDSDNHSFGSTDHYCCAVFEKDGATYRAVAELPDGLCEKIWEVEYDENHDKNIAALVSDIPLIRFENLTKDQPTQAECDALVGKTGQDLLDDGWVSWGYNLESGEFWMEHGAYAYIVVFDTEFDLDSLDFETFDEYETIAPLTVKSVTCTGVGNGATDILDELETALIGD